MRCLSMTAVPEFCLIDDAAIARLEITLSSSCYLFSLSFNPNDTLVPSSSCSFISENHLLHKESSQKVIIRSSDASLHKSNFRK